VDVLIGEVGGRLITSSMVPPIKINNQKNPAAANTQVSLSL
jgi:hypothetical protein